MDQPVYLVSIQKLKEAYYQWPEAERKAYIKSKGMMTSSDAIGALNDAIYKVIDAGITRTKANKRSTVKAQDV